MTKHTRKCSLEECNNRHYMKNFCIKHFRRWEKRGDPRSLGQAPHHAGSLCNGYRVVMKNGITKGEHRWVMEKYLDRPLHKDEIVHHINENKLDNRIENLEVMTLALHLKLHKTGVYRNPNNTTTQRQCATCKEIKLLHEFGSHKGNALNKSNYCKLCGRLRNKLQARKRRNHLLSSTKSKQSQS